MCDMFGRCVQAQQHPARRQSPLLEHQARTPQRKPLLVPHVVTRHAGQATAAVARLRQPPGGRARAGARAAARKAEAGGGDRDGRSSGGRRSRGRGRDGGRNCRVGREQQHRWRHWERVEAERAGPGGGAARRGWRGARGAAGCWDVVAGSWVRGGRTAAIGGVEQQGDGKDQRCGWYAFRLGRESGKDFGRHRLVCCVGGRSMSSAL